MVRGGRCESMEGTTHPRNVVVEFANDETALACYHSDEYQAAKKLRNQYADANLLIIEGVDG